MIRLVLLAAGVCLLLIGGLVSAARRQAPQPPWIYFSSTRSGQVQIYRMRPDGSYLQQLTHLDGIQAMGTVSPDGAWVVFSRASAGTLQLFRMRAHGGQVTQLTHAPDATLYPAWSPDGARIAYVSWQNYKVQLQYIDVQGNLRRAVSTPFDVYAPSWSPRGDALAFVGGDRLLYRMNRSGGGLGRLPTGLLLHGSVAWSPDGALLAFDAQDGVSFNLYTLDLLGGGVRRVLQGGGYVGQPSWSPDATWLAVSMRREGNTDLYRLRADGSALQRLTAHPAEDTNPVWMPLQELPWLPRGVLLVGVCLLGGGLSPLLIKSARFARQTA